jgi:ABC-2 type transport system ATP-binding protein
MNPVIQIKDLDFYYGRFKALDGVELAMEPGTYGLLGPNGAGKTTLLKILLGFLKPARGTGHILDFTLGRDNVTMKRKIGYVPEINCLIPAMDGITHTAYLGQLGGMPRQEAMKRAHEVLYYVGLDEARYRKVDTYSSGMKQRLKLAAALVHDPRLLFLDEPTSGMDPKARKDMLNLINDISSQQHMNILISSHILADIEMTCREIIIINKGRIIRQEKVESGLNRHNIYDLKIHGDLSALQKELPAVRFHRSERHRIQVRLPRGFKLKRIFEAAKASGTQIRHLVPQKTSLKDVFVSAVEEKPDGH